MTDPRVVDQLKDRALLNELAVQKESIASPDNEVSLICQQLLNKHDDLIRKISDELDQITNQLAYISSRPAAYRSSGTSSVAQLSHGPGENVNRPTKIVVSHVKG